MMPPMKILLYKEALFATYTTDFCGTHCSNAICTADTIVDVIEIQKAPYLYNNDRRDILVIEARVCDGGEYLMVMPGSYEVL